MYLVAADGSNLRLLVNDASYPAWTPDASQIAYVTDSNAVETIAPGGSGKRILLPPDDAVRRNDRQVKSDLAFSPDRRTLMWCANGRRIAFSAPADPMSRAAFESLRVYM